MNTFSSYPFFIQGTILVIALVLICLMVAYFNIMLVRLKARFDNRLVRKYEPRFRELMIHGIVAKTDPDECYDETLSKFRDIDLSNKRVRSILVKCILNFRGQFSGKTSETLRKLYLALDLQDHTVRNLRSNNVHVVIMSIKELMQMEISESQLASENFLNHKNRYIREITRKYIITTEKQGVSMVFNSITEPISGIEQLELFEVISELEILMIPDFCNWIKNDLPRSLVSLCLKLTVHFQQYSCAPIVLQLLTTEDNELKKEVIKSLGKLLQVQSEPSLVAMYDEQDEDVKVEIIKALGRIGSGNQLNLLKYIFDNEPALVLKKHAAKSIVNHDSLGMVLFNSMHETASLFNRTILNHASNPNIRY